MLGNVKYGENEKQTHWLFGSLSIKGKERLMITHSNLDWCH